MSIENFVWADLSTFDLNLSKRFYGDLFNWQIDGQPEEYNICTANGAEAAGLYVMPEFFQKINMPTFWMSYIQVDDIQRVVDLANSLGGKVELGPEPFGNSASDGQIALIRDPLGAGFTVFQGENLKGKSLEGAHGRMAWNELVISDITRIQPFYEALFNWKISRIDSSDRFDIHNSAGELVGNIEQIPNSIKGKLEFWGIYFTVADLDQARRVVEQHGGSITYDDASTGLRQLMVTDPQGAAFFMIEGGPQTTGPSLFSSNIKWRSILGLVLVFLAVIFNWTWVWSLLFLLWVVPDIFSGVTYFLEPVTKYENPILYWGIISTWLVLAIYPLFELI